MHHAHHHVSVPHLHWHTPHVDWHEVEHPVRALLVAALALSTAGTVAWVASAPLPAVSTAIATAKAEFGDIGRAPPAEQRWYRKTVPVEHMYREAPRGPLWISRAAREAR